MSSTFDPSTDFVLVTDLLETVTLRRADTGAVSSIAHTLRREVTQREAEASGGKYTRSDLVWHLPAGELSVFPRLGDQLIDADDAKWTILEIQLACGGARLRCLARNLAVAAGLSDEITIQVATWSKTASGAASATWNDSLTGLAARIQPQTGEVTVTHDRREMRITHRIIVAEAVDVNDNHRVLDADGNVYHVVGYEQPARIDVLPVILAVQSPWPLE